MKISPTPTANKPSNQSENNSVPTQKLFFNCLTNAQLNELLHRIDSGKLEQDIINRHPEVEETLQIQARVSKKLNNNTSIYINFSDEQNNQIYHFSAHLCPKYFKPKSQGPLHIKNNRVRNGKNMRTQRIRINTPKKNTLKFSLGKSATHLGNIPENARVSSEAILNVLSDYFDPSSSNSLLTYSDSQGQPHPHISTIVGVKNTALSKLKSLSKTRRRR